MKQHKKILIIGASSAIATACARLWLTAQPNTMILAGRDSIKLEQTAADFRVRSPATEVSILTPDFMDSASINSCVQAACASGLPDLVLIAHGSLPDQTTCQQDLLTLSNAVNINALSPVLFAEAFASQLSSKTAATLCIIGSVAGDRGRKSNYVYGASKAFLDRYVQGLQHRFAGTGNQVILVKPGPTDTSMTLAMQEKGVKVTPVADVANDIVNGIEKKKSVIYTPGKWRFIMLIIKHLPAFIFNKLNI